MTHAPTPGTSGDRRHDPVAILAFGLLILAMVGSHTLSIRSLQREYDGWRVAGERPPAPPAVSGAPVPPLVPVGAPRAP